MERQDADEKFYPLKTPISVIFCRSVFAAILVILDICVIFLFLLCSVLINVSTMRLLPIRYLS